MRTVLILCAAIVLAACGNQQNEINAQPLQEETKFEQYQDKDTARIAEFLLKMKFADPDITVEPCGSETKISCQASREEATITRRMPIEVTESFTVLKNPGITCCFTVKYPGGSFDICKEVATKPCEPGWFEKNP